MHSRLIEDHEECVWEMVRSKSPPARPAKDPRRILNEQKKKEADVPSALDPDDEEEDEDEFDEDEDEEGEYVLREAVFEIVAGPGVRPFLSGGESDSELVKGKKPETVVIQYATRVVSLLPST